jgi:hypothetical protein
LTIFSAFIREQNPLWKATVGVRGGGNPESRFDFESRSQAIDGPIV